MTPQRTQEQLRIQEESDRLVKEWVAKGNTITKLPYGLRTDPAELEYKNKWGARGKKKKQD